MPYMFRKRVILMIQNFTCDRVPNVLVTPVGTLVKK